MHRLLILACDALNPGVLNAPENVGCFPGLNRLATGGFRGECVHPGPALGTVLWGGLAAGNSPKSLSLPAIGTEGPEGSLWPATSADWSSAPPWHSGTAGTGCIVVNWPGTYPVDTGSGSARIVSDGWFADPDAADGISEGLGPGEEFRELRITADSLDPSVMRLLLADLTPAEVEADPRTQRLAAAVSRLYTQLNVAVAVLAEASGNEAWIRLPFLAEVEALFGPFCRHTGEVRDGNELGRRYGGILTNAHRLMDSVLAQILDAAGDGTRVGVFGGWSRRPGARNPGGPLGGLQERTGPGVFLAAGPGVSPSGPGSQTAESCLAWLRTGSGIVAHLGTVPRQAAPVRDSLPETVRLGLLNQLVNEGLLRPRDRVVPGAGRFWSRATGWFESVQALDSGGGTRGVSGLLDVWERAPEFAGMTFLVGHALATAEEMSAARQLVSILGDDGDRDPNHSLWTASLALAVGDAAAADRALTSLPSTEWNPARTTLEAELRLQQGDVPAAFAAFGELVRRNSRDAAAWMGLVRCYSADRRFADAARALHHAEPLLPGSIPLLLLGAEVAEQSGDRAEAKTRLAKAERLDPAHPLVHRVAARLGFAPAPTVTAATTALGNGLEVRTPPRFQTAGAAMRFRFEWLPNAWALEPEDTAVAWLTGSPARIAALASWRIHGRHATLRLLIRHRWRSDETGTTHFLRHVLAELRKACPGCSVSLTVPAELAELPALGTVGLFQAGLDQVQVISDIPAGMRIFQKRDEPEAQPSPGKSGWVIRDAVAEDIPWLQGLFCRPGLLTPEQFDQARCNPAGRFVLVAELHGRPVGATLLHQQGLEAIVEVENADLERRRDWLGFKQATYRSLFHRLMSLGVVSIRYTTNPATNRRIINFSEFVGARTVYVGHHFVLPGEASPVG